MGCGSSAPAPPPPTAPAARQAPAPAVAPVVPVPAKPVVVPAPAPTPAPTPAPVPVPDSVAVENVVIAQDEPVVAEPVVAEVVQSEGVDIVAVIESVTEPEVIAVVAEPGVSGENVVVIEEDVVVIEPEAVVSEPDAVEVALVEANDAPVDNCEPAVEAVREEVFAVEEQNNGVQEDVVVDSGNVGGADVAGAGEGAVIVDGVIVDSVVVENVVVENGIVEEDDAKRLEEAFAILTEADRVRRVASLAAEAIKEAAISDTTILNAPGSTDDPKAASVSDEDIPADVISDILATSELEALAMRQEGESQAKALEEKARAHLRGLSIEHCRAASAASLPAGSDISTPVPDATAEVAQAKATANRRWLVLKQTTLLDKHSQVKALVDGFAKIQAIGAWDPTIPPAVQSAIFSPDYRPPSVPARGVSGREMYFAKKP